MHLKLLAALALGSLGTLHAQTCTTSATNPTPSQNPGTVKVCYTVPATGTALSGATPATVTVNSSPSLFTATTVLGSSGVTFNPTVSGCTAAAVCTAVTTTTASQCVITISGASCTVPVGTELAMYLTTGLNNNPASGYQLFSMVSTGNSAVTSTGYAVANPSPSPIQDSTGVICSALATTTSSPTASCSYTQAQYYQFVTLALGLSPTGQGSIVCPSNYGNAYIFELVNPNWVQTISSTGARSFTVYYWGNMLTTQMTALAITYPVTAANLQALNLNTQGIPSGGTSLVPAFSTPQFLVRVERMTTEGVLANNNNPLNFIVHAGSPVTTLLAVTTCTGAASTVRFGEDVQVREVGGPVGSWATSATGEVLVFAQLGGLFIGYSSVLPSPSPIDEGSDEALLGLLGLLGLPFMLCCCLALWMWHRAKNAPFPCHQNPCPCPMQECAVQQCVPVPIQTVAVTAVPPCTPIFPMPYY